MTKKMISLALSAMLVLGLSVSASAQAAAPSVDESVLLEAAQPVLDAYKAHYVVEDVHAVGITEVPKETGGYYVEYILNFDAALKYGSAPETPRVREGEDEYMGESSEFNVGLRASIDEQGNLTELEYATFDGYGKDISTVIPESETEMIRNGAAQFNETALTSFFHELLTRLCSIFS